MLGTLSSPPHTKKGDSVLKAIPKYLGRPRILPFQEPEVHSCSRLLKIILIFFSPVEMMVEQVMGLLKTFCTGVTRPPPQRTRWEIFGGFMHLLLLLPLSSVTHHIRHGHICVWMCV